MTDTETVTSIKIVHRCTVCNKKVGLLGFTCKCKLLFCSEHRAAEDHACAFDYKKEARELLQRRNPQVIAPKLTT